MSTMGNKFGARSASGCKVSSKRKVNVLKTTKRNSAAQTTTKYPQISEKK